MKNIIGKYMILSPIRLTKNETQILKQIGHLISPDNVKSDHNILISL